MVGTQYTTPTQQYSPISQPMYPPHYDGRRVYPSAPQSYQREELLDMAPAAGSPYVPEARERYQQVEGYYPVAAHPGQIRPPYNRYLDEELKVSGKYKGNDYSQYSPWSCDTIGSYIGTKDAKPKDVSAGGCVEVACILEGEGCVFYSDPPPMFLPLSGNVTSAWAVQEDDRFPLNKFIYIEKPPVMSVRDVTITVNAESKALRDQRLELQRRAPEAGEDDLIPFGDRPTVSRFGAISRTSKNLYQPSGLMQPAMGGQGVPTKPSVTVGLLISIILFYFSTTEIYFLILADYSLYSSHGGLGAPSYSPHQNLPSQGHLSDRDRMPKPIPTSERDQLRMELHQLNQQISQQTQVASNRLLVQRESSTLGSQQQPPPPPPAKWSTMLSNEQLSLELHQVEREIGKRTRELSMESHPMGVKSKSEVIKVENGQLEPQTKVLAHELPLTFSNEVPNGSSLAQDITMLSGKTASLTLSEDAQSGGDKNEPLRTGVNSTAAP
ncbi:unnamed protein product [Ranitomeya imitator]|uniref:Uncharacterized protein n=1 Tax=Ranitomeya imitator TaxID=111125 RepID=A0ABN9LPD4_9NEOB|nr:unnamed protein product [Ranitomeya imitator]